MPPQVGISGGTPSPRNDRLASARMAVAMEKVAITIAAASRFGRIWRETTQVVPAPITCDAATNSLLRSTSACARAIRQYGIQRWIDSARMMLVRDRKSVV